MHVTVNTIPNTSLRSRVEFALAMLLYVLIMAFFVIPLILFGFMIQHLVPMIVYYLLYTYSYLIGEGASEILKYACSWKHYEFCKQ
jgi:hypothetical protein